MAILNQPFQGQLGDILKNELNLIINRLLSSQHLPKTAEY